MAKTTAKPDKPPMKARKQPSQARAKATVDAIIEATERVLAQRGLTEASTTEIADIAGVSVGTLYQYFPNKQALVAAVIEARLERDRQEIAEALERARPMPLVAGLAELSRVMAMLYRDEPHLYREMVEALTEVERERRVEAIIADTIAGMAELLAARRDEHDHPDPEIAAWVLVNNGVLLLRAASRERPEWVIEGKLFAELERMGARYLGLRPP